MMTKQPTGLKRGLPPSVEPEDSEIPKKHKQDRISPPPHPPPANHHQHTPLKNNGYLPSPATRADTSPKETASPPYTAIPTPALDQFASPGTHESNTSQPVSGSQTQPFSQLIFPPHSLAYEVDDEEKEGVWGYLIPVDGKSGKFGTLVLRERMACTSDDLERIKASGKVDKEEYVKQEQEFDKKKEQKNASQGYLIGRHPECGMYCAYPRAC
jgi:serine/threonine-protein kinase Chk2